MKKTVYLLIVPLLIILIMTSCQKHEIINQVTNRDIIYNENITIDDFEDVLVEAVDKAKESVVGIITYTGIFNIESHGSGVIINSFKISDTEYKYYVLTNRHVIANDDVIIKRIYISFGVKEEMYSSKVIAYDKVMDVAILEFTTPRVLNSATINQESIQTGRYVIAIGSPYELYTYYNTATFGNISCEERIVSEKDMDNHNCQNRYLQHDAPISAGNSGGGLFNSKGELIGINSWKIVDNGIDNLNFAIRIDDILSKYQSYFE